ncbi:MAG: hypothetical protein IKS99_07595 [Firmicutes bacterium]|nr:hypothetical protein [Bacillota bacterium]MBR6473569.1 hypothetical protein [Bacillota bacterium]
MIVAPEGFLRVSSHKSSTHYYQVLKNRDTTGKYLNKKDVGTAEALAQKDYDRRILASAKNELAMLEKLIDLQSRSVETLYDKISPKRQPLISPIALTDEQFIRKWFRSMECEPMGFKEGDPLIYSMDGIRVRSKSEQLWADSLKRLDVPYVYEPMILLEGHGWARPDFGCLNVRKRKTVFVEHLGMMDDPSYAEEAVRKIHDYENNGLILGDDFLITMETRLLPLDPRSIDELVKRHLL